MSRLIHKLEKPVRLTESSPEVTQLVFRDEMVAGDLRGIRASSLQDPDFADILKIAGRMCGQTDALMNKLSIGDLARVSEIVIDFLSGGLGTGTSGSPSSPPPSTSPSPTSEG